MQRALKILLIIFQIFTLCSCHKKEKLAVDSVIFSEHFFDSEKLDTVPANIPDSVLYYKGERTFPTYLPLKIIQIKENKLFSYINSRDSAKGYYYKDLSEEEIRNLNNTLKVLNYENMDADTCLYHGNGGFLYGGPEHYLIFNKKIEAKWFSYSWFGFCPEEMQHFINNLLLLEKNLTILKDTTGFIEIKDMIKRHVYERGSGNPPLKATIKFLPPSRHRRNSKVNLH